MRDRFLKTACLLTASLCFAGCSGQVATTSAGSATEARARPLGEGSFKVQWLDQNIPKTMKAGQEYRVRVTLKNLGNESWPSIGVGKDKVNQVSLSYHWLAASGTKEEVHDGERTNLPADVAP